MATTPPGWYDDGHGSLRWWDGAQWTEHVAAPDPEPVVEEPVADADADPMPDAATEQYPDYSDAPPVPPLPPTPPYAGSDATYSGGFVAATEPNKSKLWILWVVLGVVLLGFVVAIAVVVPMLIFGFAATSGSSTATGVDVDDENERAAVAIVEQYDQAWNTADCELYFGATTESLRAANGVSSCDDFVTKVATFDSTTDDYRTTITDVDDEAGTMIVETDETYLSLYDDEGNDADPPVEVVDNYEYVLVSTDGGWAIDEITRF